LRLQLSLSQAQRPLVSLDLRDKATDLGCFLGCHAAVLIKLDGSVRHGRIPRTDIFPQS
jgi:hypothetical protein